MSAVTNKQISEYLDSKNIGHANLGYVYLMTGIRMLLDEEVDRAHVVRLYAAIAEKHDTKPNYVERAIRLTINKAGVGGTNKQFITLALDHLIYQQKP